MAGGIITMRRLGVALAISSALSVLVAGSALAGKPEHFVEPSTPLILPAGEPCEFAVRMENTVEKAKITVFDVSRDGSQRTLLRGFLDGLITNLENLATYPSKGGAAMTIVTEEDGSLRVDVRGTAFVAWYLEGDESNLEPGLYEVNGHATEWYAPDGTFVRAVVRGRVVNLCDTLD